MKHTLPTYAHAPSCLCAIIIFLLVIIGAELFLTQPIYPYSHSHLQREQAIYNLTQPIHEFNLSEISPNNKVKLLSVNNWGKKYRPIRVWCCIVALYDKFQLQIIQDTWGKYCDKLLFFIGDNTVETEEEFNVTYTDHNQNNVTLNNVVRLQLNYTGKRLKPDVWEKCWKMYRYVYQNYFNEFDWIIRADMDTWFSPNNFKGYVQYFDSNQPWWFGHPLLHLWRKTNIIMNAGGCFALSREAMRLMNRIFKTTEFLNPPKKKKKRHRNLCENHSSWRDDADLALCLKTVGVWPTNSNDIYYRRRWIPVRRMYLNRTYRREKWWFWLNQFEHLGLGRKCCSDNMIQLHAFKNKTKRYHIFLELDGLYNKYNWELHPLPPKPTTFWFNTNFTEIDEYFNIRKPPKMQKIWKGVDNLWNYVD